MKLSLKVASVVPVGKKFMVKKPQRQEVDAL